MTVFCSAYVLMGTNIEANAPGRLFLHFPAREWVSKHFLEVAFTFAILALVSVVVSQSETLRLAIAINSDEGFEVTKAVLWANGYELYDRVWNNQPPLHTVLLGVLFKCFGASFAVARGLAMCFGLLLTTACFVITKRRSGMLAAYTAAFCVVAAPEVLQLSLAAMLEVPAIGVGLCAFWPLQHWSESRRQGYLILSGILFAIALQLKLTAVILAPALTIEILLTSRPCKGRYTVLIDLLTWCSAVAGLFLALTVALGGSYDQMWASLFSSVGSGYLSGVQELRFHPRILLEHSEGILGAGVGLIAILFRRDWRRGLPMAILLATVLIVHSLRRPYWTYYYVHFAVPLALLTGYGVGEIFRAASKRGKNGFLKPPFFGLAGGVALLILIYCVVAPGRWRLMSEIERVAALERAYDSQVINQLKRYRSETKWVYSRDLNSTFHAKVLPIPELAVLPNNRFWSGRITPEQVWEIVKRYRPEQILLTVEVLTTDGRTFIHENYSLVFHDGDHRLFVIKPLLKANKVPFQAATPES